MNVLSLSYHCCIRVIKQAIAFRACDDAVSFHHMQYAVANKECTPALERCSFWLNQQQLEYKIKMLDGIDLIHVHNEPDWLVMAAKNIKPDVPVVYDVHDMASTRDIDNDELIGAEKEAMALADAYIFPSQGYEKHARRYHNIPDSKPSIVAYSYCNAELLCRPQLPRQRGIAYNGHAVAANDPAWSYRDHRYLVEYCTSQNIPISMYGMSDPSVIRVYRDLGAIVLGELPYVAMLDNLSRSDWCFVGCSEPNRTLQHAMPNKLFESIMAGVPAIVCNDREAGEFVEKHGLGVNVNTIYEIPEIYEQHRELRKNVQAKRHEFIMESQTGAILDLYKRVCRG